MNFSTLSQENKRSFPEARGFLLSEIIGPDYSVKHLIEQARNKRHITKGKRGRGGGVVTSQDMAMLLVGTLAGETPQIATDAMSLLSQLQPNSRKIETYNPKSLPLYDGWWNLPFIEMITQFIDVSQRDFDFSFDEMSITVIREPYLYGKIIWNILPYGRDECQIFNLPNFQKSASDFKGRRHIEASYGGRILIMVADWLEGREEHP